MRNRLFAGLAGMIAIAGLMAAQAKVSKKEYDAFMAIQNAPSPEMQIEAADKFVTSFADSQLKSVALFLAANAAERKGDATKAIVYAQSSLDADPKNYQAMIMISGELARGTHENDLDKEEKLARADKLANDAIAMIPAAPKPNAQLTDDQWADAKKDFTAQAHEDLGMAAAVRKKYDIAIAEFKAALETGTTPNTTTMVRLAGVYDQAGKPTESLPLLTKVLASPNLQPVVKQFAEREKIVAQKLRAAGGPASPAPASATPGTRPLASPAPASKGAAAFEVILQEQNGILLVPVVINDKITLNFILDSGASDVSIPADVASTLMRTGTLTEADFTGTTTYVLADGSKVPSATFRIRSLEVGGRVLENVSGSVAPAKGSLLLGQSFLSRFKSWSIDNARQVLVLQ